MIYCKPGVKFVQLQGKFLYPNAPNLQPFAVQQTDCSCHPPLYQALGSRAHFRLLDLEDNKPFVWHVP